MGDRISMLISVDSPSDKTLNRGPLVLLLRRQYEFPQCYFQLIKQGKIIVMIFLFQQRDQEEISRGDTRKVRSRCWEISQQERRSQVQEEKETSQINILKWSYAPCFRENYYSC